MRNESLRGVPTWLNQLIRSISAIRPYSGPDLVPIPVTRSAEEVLERSRLLDRTWHPRPP